MNTETTAPASVPEELLTRHSVLSQWIAEKGLRYDQHRRVISSALTPFGFRPMTLPRLVAMYMARQGEVSFDMGHAIADEVERREQVRRAELEARQRRTSRTPAIVPSNVTIDLTFEVDQEGEILDEVLANYAAAETGSHLRQSLLAARLCPSEWGLLVARHKTLGIVAVCVAGLDAPYNIDFHCMLLSSDLTYVKHMFYQYDKTLLADRRERRYLYLALQNLRTLK